MAGMSAGAGKGPLNIYILAHYSRMGACSRYRFYQYLPELQNRGHRFGVDFLYQDFMLRLRTRKLGLLNLPLLLFFYVRRALLLLKIRDCDCVVVEKEVFPQLPAFFDLAFLKLLKGRVVFDYDDAVFHKYDGSGGRLARLLCDGKIARLMKAADALVVGNGYLLDYARGLGVGRVELIPTVVDAARYPLRRARPAKKALTIGWIGTGPNARHLKLIEPALAALSRSGAFRLEIIGGARVELDLGIATDYLAWSEESEVALLEGLDIGVMPLFDGPWEKGKCGLKLVQYMAAGLPVVASGVGANREIVRHGVDGYLAGSPEEWLDCLSRLSRSAALRRRMGAAGRKRVEKLYSLGARMDQFEAALRGVAVPAARAGGKR